MTERRIEINPGEYFLVADRTILVNEHESVLGDAVKIGRPESEPTYFFTFKGRINNSTERDAVTVALPLISAWELVQNILDGLELFKEANELPD